MAVMRVHARVSRSCARLGRACADLMGVKVRTWLAFIGALIGAHVLFDTVSRC